MFSLGKLGNVTLWLLYCTHSLVNVFMGSVIRLSTECRSQIEFCVYNTVNSYGHANKACSRYYCLLTLSITYN